MEKPAREGRIDLGAAFDRLPTQFMVLDRSSVFVGLNKAYLEASERTRDSILGRHILDAFPIKDESQRLLIEPLERARDSGRTDELAFLEYAVPRPEALGDGFERRLRSLTHSPIPLAANAAKHGPLKVDGGTVA